MFDKEAVRKSSFLPRRVYLAVGRDTPEASGFISIRDNGATGSSHKRFNPATRTVPVASENISEEKAVSKAGELIEEHKGVSSEDYELSGVIDYTEFGKWRMIFDVNGEDSAVKVDIDRAGNLADSNNLK